jgi:hypothetical protein
MGGIHRARYSRTAEGVAWDTFLLSTSMHDLVVHIKLSILCAFATLRVMIYAVHKANSMCEPLTGES